MPFMGLTESEARQLELEIVPNDTRLKLTRIARDACDCEDPPIELVKMSKFVNMANNVMHRQIFELESDDWGEEYPHAAYAVIRSQFELIMRRPTTVELAEMLGDYLQARMLERSTVNEVLKNGNCGFAFRSIDIAGADRTEVRIEILPTESIAEPDLSTDHYNIRVLAKRMDHALEGNDPSGVLHASASIFETLAKDVVKNPKVEKETLGSFFQSYRIRSKLPDPILDYIDRVYKTRNTEPLAGHGSTTLPTITQSEAIVLAEMTKAIVRSERKLAFSVAPVDESE